jgi:hypothetical protein
MRWCYRAAVTLAESLCRAPHWLDCLADEAPQLRRMNMNILADGVILVAIAADALIYAGVSSSDPAVEVRGGRALGRAWMSYRLSRRSQIIFVQKSCGFLPGGRASAGLSLNHSYSDDSRAQERNKKRFHHSVLPE